MEEIQIVNKAATLLPGENIEYIYIFNHLQTLDIHRIFQACYVNVSFHYSFHAFCLNGFHEVCLLKTFQILFPDSFLKLSNKRVTSDSSSGCR